MTSDTLQTIGKFVVAVAVIVGCFVVIAVDASHSIANDTQPWTVIGLIVGWIVRDSAGQSATSNAVKIATAATPAP